MGGREMKVYLSLPISGQPTKERMDYANQVKQEIECTYRCGWGYFKFEDELNIITPFDVCPEPDKPYSYYWARILKPCWGVMPSIYAKGGRTQKVVWQSSRWQEFTVKK